MKTPFQTILDATKDFSSALVGFLILFAALSFASSSFFTANNLVNVARQMSINMITAVGMTIIIITAGIDLSIGATYAMSGTALGVLFVHNGIPFALASLIVLALCFAIGAIKGWIIITQSIPPFIVTFALSTVILGCAFVMTGGRPIAVSDPAFRFLGRGFVFGIPVPVLLMIVTVMAGHSFLARTKTGRHVYAYGGNAEAARLCGIDTQTLIVLVYGIGSFLAGLSGIILASRLSSGSPTVGTGAEMDAIAATILGGTKFEGGKGSIIGTVFGSLIIACLSNGMNLLNVSSYNQMVVKGLVILLAVWVNRINIRGYVVVWNK